jgi:hypothetical protein
MVVVYNALGTEHGSSVQCTGNNPKLALQAVQT